MKNVIFDTGTLCKILSGSNPMDGIGRYTNEMSIALLKLSEKSRELNVIPTSIRYPQYHLELERYYKSLGITVSRRSQNVCLFAAADMTRRIGVPFSAGGQFGNILNALSPIQKQGDLVHWPLAIHNVRRRKLNCVTIHDIIPISHPELCSEEAKRGLAPMLEDAAKKADFFFSVSEYTKQAFCDNFNICPNRVAVTPLAANKNTFYPIADREKIENTLKKYHIPRGNYILSLAAIDPRKNLRGIVESFAKVVSESKPDNLRLVLAGEEREGTREILADIRSRREVADKIVFTGRILEEDLAAVYSGAILFANPSFIEGFGLPPLEAMQCGTPVISSNCSSIPEVTGDAAVLVDPAKSDEIAGAILSLLINKPARMRMSVAGIRRAAEFSWEKTARLTANAYTNLL